MQTIVVNGRWDARERCVASLTQNQQWALESHLRHLEQGEPILADLGFEKGGPTAFFRGQPETRFNGPNGVAVYFVGLSHWQVFKNGSMTRGTREVENLSEVVLAAVAK